MGKQTPQCRIASASLAMTRWGRAEFLVVIPTTVRKSFIYHHMISQDQVHEPQLEQPGKTQPHMLDRVKQWDGEL